MNMQKKDIQNIIFSVPDSKLHSQSPCSNCGTLNLRIQRISWNSPKLPEKFILPDKKRKKSIPAP